MEYLLEKGAKVDAQDDGVCSPLLSHPPPSLFPLLSFPPTPSSHSSLLPQEG